VPEFNAKPDSQAVVLGSNVTLSVSATGSVPLNFQWSLNGVPLPTGTNADLALTGITASQLGDYTVRVANACGTNTSGPFSISADAGNAPIAPLLTAIQFLKGNFLLTFASKAGWTYVVEYKNELSDVSWTELTSVIGDGLEQQLVDTPPQPGMRFYRVRVPTP
jgi:Ig-like domain-containing protein